MFLFPNFLIFASVKQIAVHSVDWPVTRAWDVSRCGRFYPPDTVDGLKLCTGDYEVMRCCEQMCGAGRVTPFPLNF